jgi:hypothetical protein
MLNPFDILKIEDNRRVTWIRAISDFKRAKSYILKVLAIAAPADYLILNQRTGARTVIRAAAETRKRRSKSPWSTQFQPEVFMSLRSFSRDRSPASTAPTAYHY